MSMLSCLFGAYEESITLESVALSTAMTLPALLLQHLFAHSKTTFSDSKCYGMLTSSYKPEQSKNSLLTPLTAVFTGK